MIFKVSLSALCLLCLCSRSISLRPQFHRTAQYGTSNILNPGGRFERVRGHTVLSATEKETLAEIRDKLEDSDYQSAFQILKRNPLTQLGAEDARSLLNNLDNLVAPTNDPEKNQLQTVDACTFLYKRLERQSVLKGFGCVDGEYPEKSTDITPLKLEQITGMSITSLTPMQRTTYWRLAGIGFCLLEFAFGKFAGIDPLTTLIPATFALFSVDQIFYRGAAFESVYQKAFPEYKKKIIYHEAGHFLLAYLLGIPVRGCVTNAWDARKYPDIKGQAGTIFYDPKLADELLNQKITRSSLDRMSVVIMGGIAAEAIRFGKAEGGAVDEQSLVGFLTSIQPPWNNLRIQGQARWAAMQAILLIREHEKSYDALCLALEEGKSVGDAILAIEENLPSVLPSSQRINDRKIRKKTMESDLLMRYIQKITWKVGGIESVNYEGNVIIGDNPHEGPSEKKGDGDIEKDIDTMVDCLKDIAERVDKIKANDGTVLPPLEDIETQIKKKQALKKDTAQAAVVGMDGYIIGGVPMKKKAEASNKPETSGAQTDEDDENETDEAVRLFKQKIRRLEKAAKAGQLDVSEKVGEGGVWLNNLDSLNSLDPKVSSTSESEKKKITFPGLGINPPNIVIPPPLDGYEARISELLKKEQKIQEEILKISNEDNVLMQISSVVDLSQIDSTESATVVSGPKSGIRLAQSTARDIASKDLIEKKSAENVPREMLLTRRGYQVKKLENSKAGFSKKVSDIDARILELKEALSKREVTSSSGTRR